jgi:hypothetical protein
LDFNLFDPDVLERFVTNEHGDFGRQLPKFLVAGSNVPNERQFVLYAGVSDFFMHGIYSWLCIYRTGPINQSGITR